MLRHEDDSAIWMLPAGVSPQTADLRTVLKEMLAAGARLLPDAQKGLTLHPVGDQPILRASAEDFGARGQPGVFIGAKLGSVGPPHQSISASQPPPRGEGVLAKSCAGANAEGTDVSRETLLSLLQQ